MIRPSRSSGDLLADRRFAYAEDLAAGGEDMAAADLLEQTLERVPRWTPAWIALGHALERLGRVEEARQAFAQAEAQDPSGLYGASLHRARLEGGAPPTAVPAAYVAALFDDYAPRFDAHLVDRLGYRGPALLCDALQRAAGERHFELAIDLGCGTGLMADVLRSRVAHLVGVDLSAEMIARARARDVYDDLLVGDLLATLDAMRAGEADLVTAADVFVYLGPLGPVVAAAARVLRPGGLLAFTAQRGEEPVSLGADMRFSHSRDHIREVVGAAGLDLPVLDDASTRRDGGAAVPGLVVVARKP